MLKKINWQKWQFNRLTILMLLLLVAIGIQSCGPGECLRGIFVNIIVFVIFAIVFSFFLGWIPFLGPILVIVIMWHLFVNVFWNGSNSHPGIKKSCGCSAFCENIKPENENK